MIGRRHCTYHPAAALAFLRQRQNPAEPEGTPRRMTKRQPGPRQSRIEAVRTSGGVPGNDRLLPVWRRCRRGATRWRGTPARGPLMGVGGDTGGVRQVVCPTLVGRAEETRCLSAALAAAHEGHGATLFLVGEAGIGKSRLVRQVAAEEDARGMPVLTGRAVAQGVASPFRPFAEALTHAVRAGELPADRGLDGFGPALGRLVPQWRENRVSGDDSLEFLGEAVLRMLRLLAARDGCLLVLEAALGRPGDAGAAGVPRGQPRRRASPVRGDSSRREERGRSATRRRRGVGPRAGGARLGRGAAARPPGPGVDGFDGAGLRGRGSAPARGLRPVASGCS
jgi:hypothetical protein